MSWESLSNCRVLNLDLFNGLTNAGYAIRQWCQTHQTLQEPGRTRYDDEELFDQLNDEGELRTLWALISLKWTSRDTDRVSLWDAEFEAKQTYFTLHSSPHIIHQLLQVLLQFIEVDAGDDALPWFGQAVSGQLSYLVVDEAEDPVGHWQNTLWGKAVNELCQPLLHLSCGLIGDEKLVDSQLLSCCQTGGERIMQSPSTGNQLSSANLEDI